MQESLETEQHSFVLCQPDGCPPFTFLLALFWFPPSLDAELVYRVLIRAFSIENSFL